MKIDLSRISICGVHDFKNAIIYLSVGIPPPAVYRTVTYIPLRYHSQYDHRVSDGDVRWLFSMYIGMLLKTKDPIRVWLLDIFCSVFSCMYC